MSIIFDYHEGEVYIENPDPKAEGTRFEKIYYFQPEGDSDEQKRIACMTVNRMRAMYDLGKQHRSEELRKALGV